MVVAEVVTLKHKLPMLHSVVAVACRWIIFCCCCCTALSLLLELKIPLLAHAADDEGGPADASRTSPMLEAAPQVLIACRRFSAADDIEMFHRNNAGFGANVALHCSCAERTLLVSLTLPKFES
jgi:hypothetical protein